MEEVGFEDMGVYVLKSQNTVAQYIGTRSILELCEKTVWSPEAWVARRLWEKERLDLSGARVASEVTVGGEGGSEEEEEER